jgi:transposase-like protein
MHEPQPVLGHRTSDQGIFCRYRCGSNNGKSAARGAVAELRAVNKPSASAAPQSPEQPVALAAQKCIGRPTLYSPELAEAILARITEGELVVDVCRDEGMPSWMTLFRWRKTHAEFGEAYAAAREQQAHAIAEGGYVRARDSKDPVAERQAFDAARWLSAKIAPRECGQRVGLEHSVSATLEQLVAASYAPPKVPPGK